MKNTFFILSASVLLAVACQSEKSIEDLKEEKKALLVEIDSIEAQIARLDTTKKDEDLQPVYIEKLEKHPFESFVEVNGVVATDQNIMVMPESSGVINQIKVQRGQKVSKGQVLAVLDNDVMRKNLEELKKQLELADELFQKQERLKSKGVGTEIDWLTSKNRKESLEKSIETMRTQINKSVVTAPIGGKVDEIFPHTGEMASPSMPFARIVGTSEIYVESEISEAYYTQVKQGDQIQIYFPFLKDTVDVKITYKANYINPDNRTFKIQASLSKLKQDFPPNLLAIVKVRDTYREGVFTVPSNVIKRDKEGDFVFVVDNGVAKKKRIKALENYHGNTVVSGELKEGMQLVVRGYSTVSPGEKVEVQN